MNPLDAHERLAADRVIAEESALRRHLVVSLSGAHAYGFPSVDSDVDLKAVHVEPTANLLGLSPPESHAVRCEVVEGVEVDYSTNEIQPVLASILAGNGNYFERFLGAPVLASAPEFDEIKAHVRGALSKRIFRHYSGFARTQSQSWEESGGTSTKRLLYVLRTALTGVHVLRTGEIIPDLRRLSKEYGFPGVAELIEEKRAGERRELTPEIAGAWKPAVARSFEMLDQALETSPLPVEAPNRNELEGWLIGFRRRSL